ncbi:hypothetical protein [Alkalitalea saponilacus]|uniref:Uncharacterized protein n=1 Tax=Alkalitalea saponilacus TaxID=889453 RepID=A0A1T5A349_9BACT|nr:hypothetical protein [Alkalitalea saponilacus]ASB48884.1 hypothetical protein CDL62_06920 [Alkalitalea saponilacus]SKB29295.1 hypothetical protein SAMN03080601_00053 [Alkalitalea saponilacus]
MKRLLNHTTLVSLIILFSFIISACRTGRTSSGDDGNQTETLDKARVEQDVREFVYPLPTSFETTEMLNRIGASYILTLSNPVSNVERYLTEKSKAINLGIYSTDLSYASTYNQRQATIDYMNVSKRLIDALNISGAVSPDIIDQIEANQDDKEKLVELITNTFYNTYEHLNRAGRGSVSMLVLAGSWVEALYIATHISEDTYQNKEMVAIVMNQKSSLNKLLSLMEVVKDNPAIDEVMQQLKPIQRVYNSIEDGAITERQLRQITDKVYVVRNQMVE